MVILRRSLEILVLEIKVICLVTPLSHVLGTKLGAKLTKVGKNVTCPWLRPVLMVIKTQVTIEYVNVKGAMVLIRVQLFSSQHNMMRL